MIQAFKDLGRVFAVAPEYPLTFITPQSGGAKDTALYLVLGTYASGSFLRFVPGGSDLALGRYTVTVKQAAQGWNSVLPNSGTTIAISSLQSNVVALSVRATSAAQLTPASFASSVIQVIVLDAQGNTLDYLTVPLLVVAADQGLQSRFRILTGDRQLPATAPGFTFGSYRWREDGDRNVLVPANWNQDLNAIGLEKFIPGVGFGSDLRINRLYRDEHSVLPILDHGEYFTGVNRYFLPSKDSRIDIFPISSTRMAWMLTETPASQLPIYCGTYVANSSGNFEAGMRYRYIGNGIAGNDGGWDTAASDAQFQLERKTRWLQVNQSLSAIDLFLGFVPHPTEGESSVQATFDIPVYPIWSITLAYVNDPSSSCQIVNFNQASGQVTLSVSSGMVGQRLYISYTPAIAVIYETDAVAADPADSAAPQPGERLLENTELNPAFCGIAKGYVYLLHRRQRVVNLTLAVDKPLVAVPATLSSIVGLLAYGPVYYGNDYAQLIATATGESSSQLIPGAELVVVPAADFEGYVDYQNPVTTQVTVTTGGDGTAPMIYTTPTAYGFYLAKSSISANHITLPETLALSQLWSATDGWYLLTYSVEDDDPVLGKVGANVQAGEISWITYGTAGTVNYRTNGVRTLWGTSSGYAVVPSQVYDTAGHPAFQSNGSLYSNFNGSVQTLEYATNLPNGSNVGAYFIGFIGRVVLQVQDLTTGVLSNSVMLQLAPAPQVQDSPAVQGYLYLNESAPAQSGRINVNRLGGAAIPSVPFYAAKY